MANDGHATLEVTTTRQVILKLSNEDYRHLHPLRNEAHWLLVALASGFREPTGTFGVNNLAKAVESCHKLLHHTDYLSSELTSIIYSLLGESYFLQGNHNDAEKAAHASQELCGQLPQPLIELAEMRCRYNRALLQHFESRTPAPAASISYVEQLSASMFAPASS